MNEHADLPAVLRQIHELELRGLMEDLDAPFSLVPSGDPEADAASSEAAWRRHRAARPAVEACLKRNGISAQIAANEAEKERLRSAVAGKLGEFRALSLNERRARALAMLLPSSVTVEAATD